MKKFFIFIIFIFFIYLIPSEDDNKNNYVNYETFDDLDSLLEQSKKDEVFKKEEMNRIANQIIENLKWKSGNDIDQLDGSITNYIYSRNSLPQNKMERPYHKVYSKIVLTCKNGKESAYFDFSLSPNLSNTTAKDGYNLINSRIKVDDEIFEIMITQNWGGNALFIEDRNIINNITSGDSLILELYWYGNGKVIFKYDLNGNREPYLNMQKECQ